MKLTLFLPLLATLSSAPSGVQNAKVTVKAVAAGGLAAEVRSAAARGASWIGYSEAVIAGPRQMCCFGSSGTFSGHSKVCCGGCRLEEEKSFSIGRDDAAPVALESPPQFRVLLRVQGCAVEKVRAFSEDCALDAGGLAFLWLTGVSAPESLELLGGLAVSPTGGDRVEDQVGQVLAAIALHADPGADAVLEKLAARGQPLELRKQAAFWLGNERGRRGFEILRAATSDPDPDFRQHLTFCLSQSSAHEALPTLIRMAHQDPEGEVRGQALFWLAQKAGDRTAETIQDAIRDDPDEQVKVKAVFALSQLRGDQAVTELIRVARTNRNPEVRKKAIFWLGQSRDPRALDFIEKILSN
jgi:HEAT repeat protein